jgi:signal transduction histidine kinase
MLKPSILTLFIALSFSALSQNTHFEQYYNIFVENKGVNDSIAQSNLNLALNELDSDYQKGLKPGVVFYEKGYDYFAEGNYKAALNSFFTAKENFSSANDTCKMKEVLFNIGCIISALGDNESAIKYYVECRDLKCDSSGISELLYHYNLGLLFSSINLHKDAIVHYKRGLDSENEIGSDELNRYLTRMALYYEQAQLGNLKKAISGHLEVLRDTGAQKFKDDLFYYLFSELGTFYLSNEQIDSAEYYYHLASELDKRGYAAEMNLLDLLNATSLNLSKNDLNQAEEDGLAALELANSMGNKERSLKAERMLMKIYEQKGQWKEALEHSQNLQVISDSMAVEKTKFTYLISEIEQADAEMKQLERKMLRNKIQLNRNNFTIIILIIFLILGGLFVYSLISGKKKRILLNKKLSASNKHKDKIITTLTHDIRSPLADVANILELMKMDALSYQDRSEIIKSINLRLSDLRESVDSILKWSIKQIKGANAVKEATAVKEVIQSAVVYVSERASTSSLLIDTENVYSDVMAYVDKSHLEVIMRNILSNAVKFSDYGEKIIVRTFIQDETIIVSVQDFGIGIEKSEFDKILGDEIYTKDETKFGVGIGLKLCKEYLAINGGKLFLESVYGEGSTFILHLPKFKE